MLFLSQSLFSFLDKLGFFFSLLMCSYLHHLVLEQAIAGMCHLHIMYMDLFHNINCNMSNPKEKDMNLELLINDFIQSISPHVKSLCFSIY